MKQVNMRTPLMLLAVASALVNAACTPSGPPLRTTVAPTTASEPPPSAYVAMLRKEGIGAAIPSSGKFVLVNIPSFELVALQDSAPVLYSRVVVGRPATPTPELLSSMSAIKFNPSWTPTPAMIRFEGLRYVPPGPNNPLGRILFELDNEELVFLHDTNDRKLFDPAQRAFSHGCVRVEKARQLAAWALGVPEGEIEAMISRGATYSVPLPQQIPVALVYSTRFPDEQGRVVTYPDIYASRVAAARTAREGEAVAAAGAGESGNTRTCAGP